MADKSPGRALEQLVAFIEGELVGKGFTLSVNERAKTNSGKPGAEFDLVVRGPVGSTLISWLIECRDRLETAGVDWIQQLPTRRSDHGFDKVTAVSTSGFSEAAIECALRNNVELRTVADIPPSDMLNWLCVPSAVFTSRTSCLKHVNFQLDATDPGTNAIVEKALAAATRQDHLIKHGESLMTLDELFLGCVRQQGDLFDGMIANAEDKLVSLDVAFEPAGFMKIVTPEGDFGFSRAEFFGELRFIEQDVPVSKATSYASVRGTISQSATFEMPEAGGIKSALEFHNLAQTGETKILIRTEPSSVHSKS